MPNLRTIDLPARLAPVLPIWAGEIVTALVCVSVAGILRLTIDSLTPHIIAPFVLLFPAALAATLIGGWRTGALAFGIAEFWAWYYVIPPRGLSFKGEAQPANLLVIAAAGALIIAVAQAFRVSARREAEAQSAEVADRELMLRELDHRVRNNFQTVASLLQLQLRRATDPPAKAALQEALGRVLSISEAHRNLYAGQDAARVDMDVYLGGLCTNLADALLLGELVRLECQVEGAALERDRAVAVGLIVNELVTNAAKHAFPNGGAGQIRVAFERCGGGYRLTVEDDGQGLPSDYATRRQGLGRGLVEAFTRQAGGKLKVGKGPGARFEVDIAA